MDVSHVAKLANLPLTPAEEKKFAQQFLDTLKTVDVIGELNTEGTEPTSQVTGLKNVIRKDEINQASVLPQDIALSQARKSYNGYFVVPAVLEDA